MLGSACWLSDSVEQGLVWCSHAKLGLGQLLNKFRIASLDALFLELSVLELLENNSQLVFLNSHKLCHECATDLVVGRSQSIRRCKDFEGLLVSQLEGTGAIDDVELGRGQLVSC